MSDLVYLKFKALEKIKFINQAVSTRRGGVSTLDGLESLNLGTHTVDSLDNVRMNYCIFCNAAGFDVNRIVLGNQTHSINVRYATESDCGKGVFCDRDYDNVDALITDVPGLPLVIHTADCVPISFVDTENKAIGNAHCGWKGTYGMLAKITLDAMREKFSTNPKDVVCTIGPCICQNCYEVSEDLYNDFISAFGEGNAFKIINNSYYIDLALINKQVLVQCGVREDNILISDLCTCCNIDYFFSHRGQGSKRGIIASFIEII